MKNIVVILLLLSSCSGTTNSMKTNEDHYDEAYLPAVGDSAIYIGSTRDREMRIVKQELDSKRDTLFLDTVYSDTVIIKRMSPLSILSFIRQHYFLENFPEEGFANLQQELYMIDSFKFAEHTGYKSLDLATIFYNDSLKTLQNDVDNISDHREQHKTFLGKRAASQHK